MTMKQEIAHIDRQTQRIREIGRELKREMALLDTGAYCGRAWQEPEPKMAGLKVGDTTVVERWDGSRWIEKKLTWNGHAFVDDILTDYLDYGKCWQAWLDGTEPTDQAPAIGYGHTEQAAVQDLIEKLEDK